MSELTLRPATEADFAEIGALYDRVIADVAGTDRDPIWDRSIHPCDEDLHAAIAAGSLLTAFRDGVLVASLILDQDFACGYEAVTWPSGATDAESLCLHLFAVDPERTNKGLGGQVLALAIDHARAAGYRAIRLDVLPWLAGPRHLYAKTGFEELGLFDLSYPDPRVKEFYLYELAL